MGIRKAATILLTLLLAATMLASCGAQATGTRSALESPAQGEAGKQIAPAAPGSGLAPEAAPTIAPAATAAPAGEGEVASQAVATSQVQPGRMVVRTGNVTLRVKDVAQSVNQVGALAEQYGGYVVNSNQWSEGETTQATMTIRVPAEKFDEVLQKLGTFATKVISANITGEDVSQEYYDIEARLKALRATEEQLLALLKDVRERTQKASDVLDVYRELTNVQTQIEQLEGRKAYLSRMVAMSTINLTLLPPQAEVQVVVEGWQPLRTAKSALRALTGTGQAIVDAVIWVALYVVPLLVILALPLVVLYALVRFLVRRGQRRKLEANHTPSSPPPSQV